MLREIRNLWGEAITLTHLGDACADAGDEDGAREAWRQAVAVTPDPRGPDAEQVRAKLADLGGAASAVVPG